jgi:hypothetical protein
MPLADDFDGGFIEHFMAAAGSDADLTGLAIGENAHFQDDLAFPLSAFGQGGVFGLGVVQIGGIGLGAFVRATATPISLGAGGRRRRWA